MVLFRRRGIKVGSEDFEDEKRQYVEESGLRMAVLSNTHAQLE